MSDDPPIPDSSLPSKHDFDPHGSLDGQCAWENFGGLTLDEANKKFRYCPETYQEDFMFMGQSAFAFYFPVIESYLRETKTCNEYDDRSAWILACGIQQQLKGTISPALERLFPRILDLANFVRRNIALFTSDVRQQHRIDSAWSQIQAYITNGEPIDDSQVPTDVELNAMVDEALKQCEGLCPPPDDERIP